MKMASLKQVLMCMSMKSMSLMVLPKKLQKHSNQDSSQHLRSEHYYKRNSKMTKSSVMITLTSLIINISKKNWLHLKSSIRLGN